MIILLMILVLIVGIIGALRTYYEEIFIGGMVLFEFIFSFVLAGLVANYPYNVNKKISMYEEENTRIEEKVKNSVLAYQEHEKDTYIELINNADLETLLIAYPDLKSNELVKMEIETYIENNKQIKKLKAKAIDKELIGWWLCFNIGLK